MEKTAEDMTIELAKGGQPFAVVRPQVVRDRRGATINLVYRIEQGSHSYVEQINIRGNVKTQDHVIRREFDLGEGDAYNRALVARAERRLKNLGYFKAVKITSEPGSTPDRVIVNVVVEEQNTGDFSVAGGYSTRTVSRRGDHRRAQPFGTDYTSGPAGVWRLSKAMSFP